MAEKVQKKPATEAAVIDPIGDEGEAPPVAVQAPTPPKIKGQLQEPRIIDQRHRAADYPGSRRFRCRGLGGEYEVAYLAVPAGPGERAAAEAHYREAQGLDAGVKVDVRQLPD